MERTMKNIWKGLLVGAFAGAGIGAIKDGLDGAGRQGAQLTHQAKAALVEADLPEKLRTAAHGAQGRLEEAGRSLKGVTTV